MGGRSAGSLYESDFHAWSLQQAEAIAERNYRAFDIENLIDEVEAVGRSQRAAIESHLRVLIIHLLKFRHQPERITVSWRITLHNQRREIQWLIARNPSLRGYPAEILTEAYRDAVRGAAQQTGLPEDRFPPDAPFTIEQILDPGFES